jgi:hypothetical protein
MAYITTLVCLECGCSFTGCKGADSSGLVLCGICRKEQENKSYQVYRDTKLDLTLEERVCIIEDWIYEHEKIHRKENNHDH